MSIPRHNLRRRGSTPRCRHQRCAFTVLELLVVIGIIALLVAVLLPTLWRVRGTAMKVMCSVRLRDLTMATTLYQQQHRVFPQPMHRVSSTDGGTTTVRPAPQRITGELLNQLRGLLNHREIDPTTPVDELPAFVQCPFVEGEPEGRGPFPTATAVTSSYYTGYSYFGRISEVSVTSTTVEPSPKTSTDTSLIPPLIPWPIPLPISLPSLPITGKGKPPMLEPAVELKPGRAADARQKGRAVLWADNVCQTDTIGAEWQFSHTSHAARGSGTTTYHSPELLLGQHRAFTDGSVEWVEAGSEELQVEQPAQVTKHASLKTLLGEFWWF